MQLSSRILTALAVLILAVAVVAVRAGSPGMVEAATGTIDVLNVGTCYTTNDDVFAVGACNDGDGDDYEVTERDSISEVGTVYATYAIDPKTAADNPRGILINSDLIKVSIQDTGRDKRTPVLLVVGGASASISRTDFAVIEDVFKNLNVKDSMNGADRQSDASPGEIVLADQNNTDASDDEYLLPPDMGWEEASETIIGSDLLDLDTGVENGLHIIKTSSQTYFPMHDDADSAVIKFFGCVDANGDNDCDTDESFKDLKTELSDDEDRGSGRTVNEPGGAVAPWLNVQVHNSNAVVQYIVYHTSERESLIGGKSNKTPTLNNDGYPASVNRPDFTKSEASDAAALTVRAKSDGDATVQNLWLYETGRFTGRYDGFLRLTDADGQGPDADSTTAGGQPSNWGLGVKAAASHMMGDAAVLGVESGPVVIEYKDTDGDTQTLTISLDTVPPDIQIDAPAHKSEDQDTSPEFVGSFNDGESGLREDSFQLYVDNTNDTGESGDSANTLALNLSVDNTIPDNPYGRVNAPAKGEVVRSIEDYKGYSETSSQFGVIKHTDVYDLDKNADGTDSESRLGVDGDRFSDGATTGTFADSVRVRIRTGTLLEEVDPYNNTIDFHALVADVAGNIGFSDSDDAGPRFIDDYGKEAKDRKSGRYNVLGWYARHIFFLDEKEPEIYKEQSVTGFYGINDDKKPVVNRSGILIAFDSAVDSDTIDTDTFEVKLDPANAQDTSPPSATVTDVTVEGREVYLLLSEGLASDATPSVHIAAGKSISDPAGNRLTRGNISAFDVNDGIAPQFTVTLNGGSGSGEGNEASDKLTNKAMTISIASDEEVNSTPSITVVCSNIAWDSDDLKNSDNDMELSDFVGQRSGGLPKSSANFSPITDEDLNKYAAEYDCGYTTDDGKKRFVRPQQVQSFSRPGLEWEYQWQNFSGDKALSDGKLTVVAYGRDRRSYASLKDRDPADQERTPDTYSWGVATAEFNYDITKPELDSTPGDGDTVTDVRPFVLLNYDDKSTVSVTKLTVDDTDQTEQVQTLGSKRFLYWPDSLAIGSHDVAVEAVDAAGNKSGSVEYKFKVAERATFNVKLIAGWNAVSLPANPIDPDIGSVFTESIVDMVAAWNGENPEAPWSIATRMEGEWSTHPDFATLKRITARYGYWVHTQGFVTQSVALVGKLNREASDVVPPDLVEIPTNPGWNFVGVIDQDGDQTQDNHGDMLKTGTAKVTADGYLGKHARAYKWDAIRSRFDILSGDDEMVIGDGIWVYYADGFGVAP